MIRLEDLFCVYYKARSNKRRSKDSVVFEQNLERNLYGLWKSIKMYYIGIVRKILFRQRN